MSIEDSLNDLQKRNNFLKSKLLHEKIKHGNFPDRYLKNEMLRLLDEYKRHMSIFKAASVVGIDKKVAMNWYVEGQRGNPKFRGFYLAVNDINNGVVLNQDIVDDEVKQPEFDGEYLISEYGDGWSYKTYVNGEKIFLISSDLDKLKEKVKAKHLPLVD